MVFGSVLRSPRSFLVITYIHFVHTYYLRVSDIGKSFWRSRFAANLTSRLTFLTSFIVALRFMDRLDALSCAIVANLGYLCGTYGFVQCFVVMPIGNLVCKLITCYQSCWFVHYRMWFLCCVGGDGLGKLIRMMGFTCMRPVIEQMTDRPWHPHLFSVIGQYGIWGLLLTWIFWEGMLARLACWLKILVFSVCGDARWRD